MAVFVSVTSILAEISGLPLFYGLHNGKLFISDDVKWVCEHVYDNEMDPHCTRRVFGVRICHGVRNAFSKR